MRSNVVLYIRSLFSPANGCLDSTNRRLKSSSKYAIWEGSTEWTNYKRADRQNYRCHRNHRNHRQRQKKNSVFCGITSELQTGLTQTIFQLINPSMVDECSLVDFFHLLLAHFRRVANPARTRNDIVIAIMCCGIGLDLDLVFRFETDADAALCNLLLHSRRGKTLG